MQTRTGHPHSLRTRALSARTYGVAVLALPCDPRWSSLNLELLGAFKEDASWHL